MAIAESLFLCLAAVAVDGDTLRCANLDEANGRVRLARIDAPERGNDGYELATQALADAISGAEVTCRLVDADPRKAGFQRRDFFGRPVAHCRTSAGDLGGMLLREKLAQKWP